MINILVTGVGSLLGQGIIKTIKKSHIKSNIFGTDYFEVEVLDQEDSPVENAIVTLLKA